MAIIGGNRKGNNIIFNYKYKKKNNSYLFVSQGITIFLDRIFPYLVYSKLYLVFSYPEPHRGAAARKLRYWCRGYTRLLLHLQLCRREFRKRAYSRGESNTKGLVYVSFVSPVTICIYVYSQSQNVYIHLYNNFFCY